MRLKYNKVKEYREQTLSSQDHRCGLCGEHVPKDEAVLDHDHKSGKIRKVLHRGCNALLGKVENNMARNHVDLLRLELICSNLASYISTDWTDVTHPTHKTPEEKKELAKQRARARRAKCR